VVKAAGAAGTTSRQATCPEVRMASRCNEVVPVLHRVSLSPVTRWLSRRLRSIPSPPLSQEQTMGKYVLGWFLGVPLIVLVAIYFIAH
jgi:hypothetical protein